MKLGFGLWNYAVATYLLEAILLLGTLLLYLRSTTATSVAGKYGMPLFVALLLLANVANIFGPPGDSKPALAAAALAAYFGFAALAFWLDRKRA